MAGSTLLRFISPVNMAGYVPWHFAEGMNAPRPWQRDSARRGPVFPGCHITENFHEVSRIEPSGQDISSEPCTTHGFGVGGTGGIRTHARLSSPVSFQDCSLIHLGTVPYLAHRRVVSRPSRSVGVWHYKEQPARAGGTGRTRTGVNNRSVATRLLLLKLFQLRYCPI